jgi:hypothetical protein
MEAHKFSPFWCRTDPYQADPAVKVHGIMYSAQQQIGPRDYVCEGSRQIGMFDNKSVWLFGGYTDVMNSAGIKQIDNRDVTKLTEHRKLEVLHKINYELNVDSYDGYSDEKSIWFYKKRLTQTQQRKATKTRSTKTVTKKTMSNTKHKSPRKSYLKGIPELETPVKSPTKRQRNGGYKLKIRKSKKK